MEVAIKEHIMEEEPQMPENVNEAVASLSMLPLVGKHKVLHISLPASNEKLLPSVVQAPTLELKPFYPNT